MLRQTPIQKDHELVCPGCGAVLQTLSETPLLKRQDFGTSAISVELLGSTISTTFFSKRDKNDIAYEKALTRLASICQKYGIPEELSILTMKRIKRKEKGLFSFREQVRQLLHLLESDDYYLFWNKAQLIKKDYENISGI